MSKNLKICLLMNFIAPYYVSVLEHLQDLVGDLRILVSTPMEPNRTWEPKWRNLRVTIQKCLTYSAWWRHEQGFSDRIWRHLPCDTLPLLIRHRPNIVISQQLGFRTVQAAIYRKLVPSSRLIVWLGLSEHTEKGLPSWRTLQRRLLLALADAVLVNGKSGTNYLTQLGVPREKIFPLPYCPEIALHLALPLEREVAGRRRLLNVGQLTSRKGLGPFLTVISKWLREHPNETCEFWLAGDGALREELKRFLDIPRLHLHFLGNVPYNNLPNLYAQGDVFVFPTLADEWGVVVNEALASGLPVLGSLYSQAVEELVEDGVNGWTFRPDRAEEIYAALDLAMTASERQMEDMRRSGRERVRLLSPQFGANCYVAAIDFVRGSCSSGLRPKDEPPAASEPNRKMEASTL